MKVNAAKFHPKWQQMYLVESKNIKETLGESFIEIHHIGSTYIPLLQANPVIDIIIVVKKNSDGELYTKELKKLDMNFMKIKKFQLKNFSKKFVLIVLTMFTFFQEDNISQIERYLAVRDYLQVNSKAFHEYNQLKTKISEEPANGVSSYNSNKSKFLNQIESEAIKWYHIKSTWKMRYATISDLEPISEVESLCFPKAEAASKESIEKRLLSYSSHFLLLLDNDKIIGFINGLVTNEPDLRDEMYDDASLHDEKGKWQMIFGLDTIPSYRNQGCAAVLMYKFIDEARKQNRNGLVLTCKDKLIHYYEKFGFINEGISQSVHGNVVWYQMRLTLTQQ